MKGKGSSSTGEGQIHGSCPWTSDIGQAGVQEQPLSPFVTNQMTQGEESKPLKQSCNQKQARTNAYHIHTTQTQFQLLFSKQSRYLFRVRYNAGLEKQSWFKNSRFSCGNAQTRLEADLEKSHNIT